MPHEFTYPATHEVPNARLLHDDTPNPPGEPLPDYSVEPFDLVKGALDETE